MNKLFIRILSGLVCVMCGLGLFNFLIISVGQSVLSEHGWSNFSKPVFDHISKNESLLVGLYGDPAFGFSELGEDAVLDSVTSSRLAVGQVVPVLEERYLTLMYQTPEGRIIKAESDHNGSEFVSAVFKVISEELYYQLRIENDFEDAVEFLSVAFGVNMIPISAGAGEIGEHDFDKLVSYDSVSYAKLHRYDSFVIRFDDKHAVWVEAPCKGSPVPIWLCVLLLLGLNLLALGQMTRIPLNALDRQLRSVENVVGRIARGELDARVTKAQSGEAIGRLSDAFNSMADHIQRLMLIQKEMIHAVSHELRTPVARIRFGVQMIADCPDEESLLKQVKGIDGDIQELDELIDEILTYARLEQGGPILAFQEANIVDIVEQVVSEQGGVKPDMDISASYAAGSDVWKDSEVEARYIHRSIQNLVGNATRYAEGKVKVVCHFDQDTCRVDVEDDGPGIPEDQWESVFTPFSRLDDSRTRSSGGYGLGLSIVRRILYWHGGQAFLGRSSMGGAKFSLVWPRKQPEENALVERD